MSTGLDTGALPYFTVIDQSMNFPVSPLTMSAIARNHCPLGGEYRALKLFTVETAPVGADVGTAASGRYGPENGATPVLRGSVEVELMTVLTKSFDAANLSARLRTFPLGAFRLITRSPMKVCWMFKRMLMEVINRPSGSETVSGDEMPAMSLSGIGKFRALE